MRGLVWGEPSALGRSDGDTRHMPEVPAVDDKAAGPAGQLHETRAALMERIAELERINGALEQRSRMKSEFLASMSHEIRTPLNAINGFAELLADQTFGQLSEEQERFVSRIIEAGQHLLQITNDVIDIAKVEAGRLEMDFRPLNLNKAASEAVKIIKGMARDRRIRVDLQPDPDGAYVLADERRLKQVLFNLLSNAAKYSPEGSQVTVVVRHDADNGSVLVTDQGNGISASDQERVFAEFERLDAASGVVEGAGLGLALSRKLVARHHGEMGIDSAVGRGSTFWFSVPLAVEPEEE